VLCLNPNKNKNKKLRKTKDLTVATAFLRKNSREE
jgi:hypothetical protein